MEKYLHKIWDSLTIRSKISIEYSEELFKKILDKYNGKKRHYHNLTHIYNMCLSFEKHKDNIDRKDDILYAIFFHDIIYRAISKNNELNSAIFMKKYLSDHLSDNSINFIYDAILSTKEHLLNENSDINYLLDLDVEILGQEWDTYNNYRKNIRKEFSIYPNFMYNKGRLDALSGFIDYNIFKNDEFIELYEYSSLENIKKEIELIN
jgi:predicted metal-dependent HD superfamily phosphohydrolase